MKVSVSDPPDSSFLSSLRASVSRWPVLGAIAAAYLVAHLPSLAPSLEDIDSINFALGLRDFDVAQHQPHPPGSPVYIALGRALLTLASAAPGRPSAGPPPKR